MTDPTQESTLHLYHPHLTPTAEGLAAAADRLTAAYRDYTRHVSPPQMAMSLESASYILWAGEQLQPRSAADFGSGFTSYVLRLVCDDVWSVDDSPEWLAWTGRFLEQRAMKTDQLILWDDYRQLDLTHGLIVYDFSCGEMRDANFGFAISQLERGGAAVLDDAQHENHQKSMRAACREHRYHLFGLQDWTRDIYRRFAALVVAT